MKGRLVLEGFGLLVHFVLFVFSDSYLLLLFSLAIVISTNAHFVFSVPVVSTLLSSLAVLHLPMLTLSLLLPFSPSLYCIYERQMSDAHELARLVRTFGRGARAR